MPASRIVTLSRGMSGWKPGPQGALPGTELTPENFSPPIVSVFYPAPSAPITQSYAPRPVAPAPPTYQGEYQAWVSARQAAGAPVDLNYQQWLDEQVSGLTLSPVPAPFRKLHALTLARRLIQGDAPLSRRSKRRLLKDAGLPPSLYATPETAAILCAPGEALGKGGILGSISRTFSIKNIALHPQNLIIPVAAAVAAPLALPVVGITALGASVVAGGLATAVVSSPQLLGKAVSALKTSDISAQLPGGASALFDGIGSGPGAQYQEGQAAAGAQNLTPIFLIGGAGVLALALMGGRGSTNVNVGGSRRKSGGSMDLSDLLLIGGAGVVLLLLLSKRKPKPQGPTAEIDIPGVGSAVIENGVANVNIE